METLVNVLSVIIGALALIGALLFVWGRIVKLYKKVPPSQAMIIYGHGKQQLEAAQRMSDVVSSGGRWVNPWTESVAYLDLGMMTVEVEGDEVKDKEGVIFFIDWFALFAIGSDRDPILTAATKFLGKTKEEIIKTIQMALSGNMRSIISSLGAAQVHQDRETFVKQVQGIVTDEMSQMGITLSSLSIRDLYDRPRGQVRREGEAMGFFEALAAQRSAEVNRTTRVSVATADREAKEVEAKQGLSAKQAQIAAEVAQAEAEKNRDTQRAAFRQEADTAKAQADAAYDLRDAEMQKALATKKGEASVEMRRQEGLAAEAALAVAQKKQQAEVIIPAEAERQKTQINADAEAYRKQADAKAMAAVTVATAQADAQRTEFQATAAANAAKLSAQADAERTRVTKLAEATGIEAVGKAEAEKTRATLAAKAAEAESIQAVGQATAEAERARLLAQADGEQKLAEARAAQGAINLQQHAIDAVLHARVEVARAYAGAMVQFTSQMKVVQFTGGNSDHGTGNPIFEALLKIPEIGAMLDGKVEALTSQGLGDILQQIAALIRRVAPDKAVENKSQTNG